MAETTAVGFPFLKLPPELHDMVLKELLVMPGPIMLVDPLKVLHRENEKNVYSKHPPIFGTFLLSKEIRQTAISIYFGRNRFIATSLGAFDCFLGSIDAGACNAIRTISIKLKRLGNASRAFKHLARCASLRSIHFTIMPGLFWPDRFTAFADLPCVQNLLKIRGIQELEVVESEPRSVDERLPWRTECIVQALQILKEPRGSYVAAEKVTYRRRSISAQVSPMTA
ncbi:hypothetical protein MMC07_009077 [Pseudocyphellaria aurata]|nr:hypothetical protein [Pseudocyphellaria aurata]